jgi:hypothetical protein
MKSLCSIIFGSIFVLSGCFPAVSFAQQFQGAVFFELGGPGLAYSVGLEKTIGQKERFAARVGLSTVLLIEENTRERLSWWAIPIGASWLVGKRAHKLELGLGITTCFARSNLDEQEGNYQTYNFIAPFATVGYRYEPVSKRWFARISATPIYGGSKFDPFGWSISPWGSIGGGWRFKL